MPPLRGLVRPGQSGGDARLGRGISTPAVDGCASISPDGLSIAFTSNRTGNFDI